MNRYLIPREHGAYAELGFPLLSGLVLGTPGVAACLFVVAAALLFMANEPLLVLLGARGRRQQEALRLPARRQLAVLGLLGCGAGLGALWLSPAEARLLALVPAVFVGALVPVVLGGRLKTLPGEMVAAAAFSAMHLPVAAAGGVSGALLWGPALLWFVTTLVATLCVHAIKARVTGAAPWAIPVAAWSALLALAAAVAVFAWVPGWRALALAASVPLAGAAVLNGLALPPKKLKQVGWTVVAANAVALTLLALSR